MDNCPTCICGTARSRDSMEHAKHHALDGLPYDRTDEMNDRAYELLNLLTTRKQVEVFDSFITSLCSYRAKVINDQ